MGQQGQGGGNPFDIFSQFGFGGCSFDVVHVLLLKLIFFLIH